MTASEAMAQFYCDVIQEICGVKRGCQPNQRDAVANILVLNRAAAKLAAWAWYSPDVVSIDRKMRAATQVAAWTPDPANVARYDIARRPWIPEEEQIVRAHSIKEAAKLLGRTEQNVRNRKRRLRGSDTRAAWLNSIQGNAIQ